MKKSVEDLSPTLLFCITLACFAAPLLFNIFTGSNIGDGIFVDFMFFGPVVLLIYSLGFICLFSGISKSIQAVRYYGGVTFRSRTYYWIGTLTIIASFFAYSNDSRIVGTSCLVLFAVVVTLGILNKFWKKSQVLNNESAISSENVAKTSRFKKSLSSPVLFAFSMVTFFVFGLLGIVFLVLSFITIIREIRSHDLRSVPKAWAYLGLFGLAVLGSYIAYKRSIGELEILLNILSFAMLFLAVIVAFRRRALKRRNNVKLPG